MKMSVVISIIVIGGLLIVSGCATLNAEKNAPPIGKFVDVGGERLHLVDTGPVAGNDGPPIVLIHGASVNLRDMKMALGDELAKSHRVIMIDRPGRGYSTRPDDGWRLETQATLIHDAIASLGAENPVIVGQSLGGAVALAYALKYQEEMSGLVFLAGVSHEWPGGVAWYNKVSGWPVLGMVLRRLVIPVYAPFAAKDGVVESFAPNDAPENYYEKSGLTLLFRPSDFKSNAADVAHLKSEIIEMSGRYASLKIPTAIMTGTSDTTVSPDIHSKQLAKEIEGSTLELLPHTGHALHHAETARVITAIERIAAGG